MSRNGGSDILVAAAVATSYSLSIGGLVAVLNDPSFQRTIAKEIILPPIEYVVKSTDKPIIVVSDFFRHMDESEASLESIVERLHRAKEKKRHTSSTPSKTNGNYPNSLLLIPECKHLENDKVDISQECKDIYDASLSGVGIELFNTNNQASKEKLMQASQEAGQKKQREIVVARNAGKIAVGFGTGTVTIYTVTRIAEIAVANNGKHDERRAN